jgi:hypothetical protein
MATWTIQTMPAGWDSRDNFGEWDSGDRPQDAWRRAFEDWLESVHDGKFRLVGNEIYADYPDDCDYNLYDEFRNLHHDDWVYVIEDYL